MRRRFSAWLGQNSSAGKQRRLLGELHTRMMSSGAVAVDRGALRQGYLPVLRHSLTQPLVSLGKEGVPAVVEALQARRPPCLFPRSFITQEYITEKCQSLVANRGVLVLRVCAMVGKLQFA